MTGLKKKLEAFGLKKVAARRIYGWIQDRMGLVLGATGRGGSGVFLELADRQVALLTAKHVVLGALCTGELTIGVCAEPKRETFEPLAIKLHPDFDAALLLVRERTSVPKFLLHSEWSLRPTPRARMPIIASGAPGLLKSTPNVTTRTIKTVKIVHYFTTVTNPAAPTALGRFVACDIDETDPDIPRWLRGMSGGPACTLRRQLVGINTAERRRTDPATGRIYVQPIDDLGDLFVNTTLYPGRLQDYVGQREVFAFRLFDRTQRPANPFGVLVNCWYFRSAAQPDDADGRIGVIYRIGMTGENGERLFPLNVVSRFRYGQDDLAQRVDQLQLHVQRIFGSDTYDIYDAARP